MVLRAEHSGYPKMSVTSRSITFHGSQGTEITITHYSTSTRIIISTLDERGFRYKWALVVIRRMVSVSRSTQC